VRSPSIVGAGAGAAASSAGAGAGAAAASAIASHVTSLAKQVGTIAESASAHTSAPVIVFVVIVIVFVRVVVGASSRRRRKVTSARVRGVETTRENDSHETPVEVAAEKKT
jgi:hypothetical protein